MLLVDSSHCCRGILKLILVMQIHLRKYSKILGKALCGGVIPVSVVLDDKDVMLHIRPGQHGSTFGGNPLASAVALASFDVIEEEKLVERSASLGEELRIQLSEIKKQFPSYIKEVRGRGLFNAVEFNSESLSSSHFVILEGKIEVCCISCRLRSMKVLSR